MVRRVCATIFRSGFVFASIILTLTAGCSEQSFKSDVTLRCPPGWTRELTTTVHFPGTLIEACKGPEGALLVVYRSLPIPDPDPEALSRDLANRLQNLPGLRLVQRDVKLIQSRKGAWVEVVAPGNTDGLAPSGTGVPIVVGSKTIVPTRQLLVGFPRAADTIWFRWTFPDSIEKTIRPQIADTLEAFQMSDPSAEPQTY